MKKFILGIAALLITFVACERELEIGSDFDFKVNNIDDSEIFINNVKSFQLEITKVKNIVANKNYEVSYKVSGGNLIIKDGSNTLIEGNYYPFEVNDLNMINLDLIPQSAGVITVKFFIKDNNGEERTKEILVYCTDEDFQYTFTGTCPNPNGIVNSGIPFSLLITNTGQSSNNFQLKYVSSGSGTITINSLPIAPNQYFNVTPGTIQGLFTSNAVGNETLTFTCIDSDSQTQQVSFNMVITANPFSLAKIADFTVKNTKQKVFDFTLTNTIPVATYQIKFTTVNTSKIYSVSNTLLSQNVWLPLTLNPNNLYSYKYESLSNTNDVLTVEVKDNYGQVQSINYAVTMLAAPVISYYGIAFTRTPGGTSSYYNCSGKTKSDILCTISAGSTLTKTKIIIKNKNTGAFDTLEYSNSSTQQQLETPYSSCFTSSSSCNASWVWNNVYTQSKYANQVYTIQIQDSDGVWSPLYNGTVTSN